MTFDSRQQAGKLLGEELLQRDISANIVVGLARGGIVVTAEVARILKIPLEVMIVRKIGAPGNPEFAVGAVAEVPGTSTSSVWWDEETAKRLGLTDEWKREQVEIKKKEVEEYRKQLDRDRDRDREYRTVVLVDDGAATGTSMLAAVQAINKGWSFPYSKDRPFRTIVALPVASTDAAERFRKAANEVVILEEGSFLSSVGQYYRDFSQVEWEEVRRLLKVSDTSKPSP